MNSHRMAAFAAVAITAAAAGYAIAGESTEPTAVREALAAKKNPQGAQGKTLGLSRVTVPAGAKLALHKHEGTQIAFIEKGTLTYTVRNGRVEVMKGSPDDTPRQVRTISAGQTGKIRAGQWLVEDRKDIHRAENKTDKRIVILLSTLLDNGAPPATPVTD